MATTYDIGDKVRLTGIFTDTGGVPADPTSVTFMYNDPSSTATNVVSTPTTAIQNPAVGTYTHDILPVSTGVWYYRIYSTGNLISAEESYFVVHSQQVTT